MGRAKSRVPHFKLGDYLKVRSLVTGPAERNHIVSRAVREIPIVHMMPVHRAAFADETGTAPL